MNFSVVITSAFLKQTKKLAKKHKSLKQDLIIVITQLELNPVQGTPLGKDCYKIRLSISSKGQGKSGGGRLITCVKVIAFTVFLIAIYDKSEKEDISDKELNLLLLQAGLSE